MYEMLKLSVVSIGQLLNDHGGRKEDQGKLRINNRHYTVNTCLQLPCLAKRKSFFVCHISLVTTRKSQQLRQDPLIEVCRTP